ncbi:type IV pilus modification protein PilV [Ramlibacter rhizophilus]|uniref:Type IV pilus modification protein PilV n=2 Tax=Ramlibacter rhizophilus TaxID=1781167 RepID=A0A4Z0BRY0_9BURK|nr:type IV pilus modification protein PilV [Ramlibacter rhizophilus]TFZ01591.1 type IV pilus modification protein PilV [Ramlibacter rhizophilus]
MNSRKALRRQRGAAMMESLIAMLIVAFGVLGFVGLQARTAVTNLEGYQRAQAMILLNDMVQRINTNRSAAGSYVLTTEYLGNTLPPTNCPTTSVADRDKCEWTKLLLGAAEVQAGQSVGAIRTARGCVQQVAGTTNEFVVAVFWEGVQSTASTTVACGYGGTTAPTYGDATLRRAVSTVVRIGVLS